METKQIYTIGIDWSEGRTPVYESYKKWMVTEVEARKYFRRIADNHGHACALISQDGRVIETVKAVTA